MLYIFILMHTSKHMKIGRYKVECDDELCYITNPDGKVTAIDKYNFSTFAKNLARTIALEKIPVNEIEKYDKRKLDEMTNRIYSQMMRSVMYNT